MRKSGDVHIAYRVEGDGPFDLVVVPPLIWPIDILGSEPEARASFQRLASFSRVIVFDKRGTGSSDRVSGAPSLEERMDDVRAVMDEVGSGCAALLGAADGGSMSLLFAATYPERVFALALFRAKPRIISAPDFPWAPSREAFDRETDEMLRRRLTMRNERELYEWRSKHRTEWSYTPQTFDEWLQESRMVRLGVSPGAVIAFRAMNRDIDVRAVLPGDPVPTLLMHRAADAPDASETGDEPMAKYMAERIPHAEVVEVAPRGHWHEAILPPLQPFLEEAWHAHERRQTESQRVLATVLFTDLVDSTGESGGARPSLARAPARSQRRRPPRARSLQGSRDRHRRRRVLRLRLRRSRPRHPLRLCDPRGCALARAGHSTRRAHGRVRARGRQALRA